MFHYGPSIRCQLSQSQLQHSEEFHQTMGGFMNDIQASFENLSQEKIQNAIDIQPKVMEAIIAADGGHTTYMSNGSAKKGD